MIIDWSSRENAFPNINQWSSFGSDQSSGGSGGDVIFSIGPLRNNRITIFTGASFQRREYGVNTESDLSAALADRFDDPDYYQDIPT